MFTLTKKEMAVKHAAAGEEGRFALNGIYVSGHYVIATNGHIVAGVKSETDFGKGTILPLDFLSRIGRALTKASTLSIHAGVKRLFAKVENKNKDKDIIISEPCPGEFPDWFRVIPIEAKRGILLNPDYMIKIGKFMKDAGSRCVEIIPGKDDLSPVLFLGEKHTNSFSVAMPMAAMPMRESDSAGGMVDYIDMLSDIMPKPEIKQEVAQ